MGGSWRARRRGGWWTRRGGRGEQRLCSLGNPREPKTIYLMLPARDIARLSGLLRLLLQQLSLAAVADPGRSCGGLGGRQDQAATQRAVSRTRSTTPNSRAPRTVVVCLVHPT